MVKKESLATVSVNIHHVYDGASGIPPELFKGFVNVHEDKKEDKRRKEEARQLRQNILHIDIAMIIAPTQH